MQDRTSTPLRVRPYALMVTWVTLLTLVTVGCSVPGGPASDASPHGPTSTSSHIPSPDAGQPSPTEVKAPVARSRTASSIEMPMTKYLEVLDQARKAAQDDWYEAVSPLKNQLETFVAKCMENEGFSYQPVPLERAELGQLRGADLGVPWISEDRSVVEKFGYGDFATIFPEEKSGEAQAFNQQYFDSLNAKAQREYELTLAGRKGYEEADSPGCIEKAERHIGQPLDSVYSADNSWFEDVERAVSELFLIQIPTGPDQEIELFPGTMQADASLRELNRAWGQCETSNGALADYSVRQIELVGPIASFNLATVRALKGSTDRAIDLALTDFDCRLVVDYIDRYTQIQHEVELRWVSEHQAELDRLVATWEQR